jgi:hypothetical protein
MRGAGCFFSIALLCSCTQTTIESYADREFKSRALTHIVAYISGPTSISNETSASLTAQAAKHGVTLDNAFYIFPPTHSYSEQVIKRELASRGVDGVLIVKVGNTRVIKEYAGTLLAGLESVSTRGDNNFAAKLIEPSTGQLLWAGEGKVTESGLLIVGNRSGPASVATAILDELQTKGLLRN